MSTRKEADHWAFLEDIEAPMWVDLAIEAKLSNKELDDEWFHGSHTFHQLPSRKLKAAFKHIDSGGKLEIDIGGSSSPKIPSSVSKSRGKYSENNKVGTDFRLSLLGTECLTKDTDHEAVQSRCGNEILAKSAHEDSKLSLHLDQEDGGGSVVLKFSNTSTMPSTNHSSSSNPLEHKVGVSDPKSSITSESSHMPGPEVVASNCIIGRRSDLLSVIKQSLRKSCATRMAVRGQITDVQQTNGLISSIGKSSVGSCSTHSQDAKDIIAAEIQRTSRTPESKNVERPSQESKTRNKVKTSIVGAGQFTNNSSDSGNSGEPLMTKAKPGSIYPRSTHNRGSSTISTSLKINTINRASKTDNRGKAGMPKNLKIPSKPAQCVDNNGSISKLRKSATVDTVPEHSSNRRKIIAPEGTMTRISSKSSVSKEVGKSVVANSTQLQVMTSKAPLVHRRPLAPVNHNDQGSHRRPLAPVKQVNQGSSTFARKTMIKGKSDASTKSFCQGKENTVSKLVTSKRQGNGNGIATGGMAEKSNRMKLTEARKNNLQGLLS